MLRVGVAAAGVVCITVGIVGSASNDHSVSRADLIWLALGIVALVAGVGDLARRRTFPETDMPIPGRLRLAVIAVGFAVGGVYLLWVTTQAFDRGATAWGIATLVAALAGFGLGAVGGGVALGKRGRASKD